MKRLGCLVRYMHMALSMVFIATVMLIQGVAMAQGDGQGSYSVVILDNQTQGDAERGKQLLEGWGYSPITISQQGNQFNVLYGEFDSATAARAVLDNLRNEGISAKGVMQTPLRVQAPAPVSVGAFAVLVQEFKTNDDAMQLQQTLSKAGFTPLSVRQAGNYYRVLITDLSREEAVLTLGQLRQQGYMTARVRSMETLTTPPPAVPAEAPEAAKPSGEPAAEDLGISAAVMQTDLWNQLTEDQKREVIKSMAIQEQLRKGDALAQEVIDINKRLSGLDENVRKIISQIEEEKSTNERVLGEIGELFKEADNLIRGEEYQEAILRLNKILALDKDNLYGQAVSARRLIERAESRLRDERYEGQSIDIENSYQKLKADAERLSANKNSTSDLQTALGLWIQIKNLDPQKYGTTANSRISELTTDLENLSEMKELALSQNRQMMLYIAIGLGIGFILLLVLLIMVWLRGRARHNQLMMKVQEITSIRPMRELQGGPTGMLEGSGDTDTTDYDIFAPQTPKAKSKTKPKPKPKLEEDSFAGLGDTKDLGPEMPVAGRSVSEDAFGGMGIDEKMPTGKAIPGDMDFNDIFEGSDTEVSLVSDEEPVDDPFAHIGEEPPARVKNAVPPPQTPPSIQQQAPVAEETVEQIDQSFMEDVPAAVEETKTTPARDIGASISFDDILSHSDTPEGSAAQDAALEKEAPEDLLALFDDVVGPSQEEETTPPTVEARLDPLQGSPFSPMQEEDQPSQADPPTFVVEDETEIPLIDLNEAPLVDATVRNETMRASEDLPSFSLDDITSFDDEPGTQESTPMPELAGMASFNGDFRNDSLGQMPKGWTGEYDYASLTVEDSNPPESGGRYICFRKPEGGGKAFYSYRFPEISGKCVIEFDLCCQEKNKFLLGFYIEKDAQFQSSIHTKILRSEAQTTPTIHIQGESASYLLGSWTHIKYMIDLNEGMINGYIDSTHVAHDLPLVQNPGSLNTFSIRDNINTTGVLMLANLSVHPVK